jgi:hypothetical protein
VGAHRRCLPARALEIAGQVGSLAALAALPLAGAALIFWVLAVLRYLES